MSDYVSKNQWRCCITRQQTVSGSVPNFKENAASWNTGACSSYYWGSNVTSSYFMTLSTYAGSGRWNTFIPVSNGGTHKQISVATMLIPPVDYEPTIEEDL